MKKIVAMTVAGLMVVSLVSCKGKTDGEKAMDKAEAKVEQSMDKASDAMKDATNHSYSKADFMKACTANLTDAQCDCYIDFYKSAGLDISDLGDQEKVTKAVQALKPEQMMEMAKCAQ